VNLASDGAEKGLPARAWSHVVASGSAAGNSEFPAAVVSPLIEAIKSKESGDCSLLRGAEMSLASLGNPREALHQLHSLVDKLTAELRERATTMRQRGCQSRESAEAEVSLPNEPPLATSTGASSVPIPSNDETPLLQYGRWAKLKREFYKPKKGLFDTTKIPDLYDNAMYDMLHNQHLQLKAIPALYATARALASYVVPQEYGLLPEDKVKIGKCIGSSMLHKLRRDLLAGTDTGAHEQERVHQLDHSVDTDVRTPHRHVRTRLYFTSESHIHSLFNVLRWGSGADVGEPSMFSDEAHALFQSIELGYLTHIVLRVLLRPGKDASQPSSYRVQMLVSPGIEHHHTVCAAALEREGQPQAGSVEASAGDGSADLLNSPATTAICDEEALQSTPQLVLASSPDLSLADVESFLDHILADAPDETSAAPPGVRAKGAD